MGKAAAALGAEDMTILTFGLKHADWEKRVQNLLI
jgi:hypothetical protein